MIILDVGLAKVTTVSICWMYYILQYAEVTYCSITSCRSDCCVLTSIAPSISLSSHVLPHLPPVPPVCHSTIELGTSPTLTLSCISRPTYTLLSYPSVPIVRPTAPSLQSDINAAKSAACTRAICANDRSYCTRDCYHQEETLWYISTRCVSLDLRLYLADSK